EDLAVRMQDTSPRTSLGRLAMEYGIGVTDSNGPTVSAGRLTEVLELKSRGSTKFPEQAVAEELGWSSGQAVLDRIESARRNARYEISSLQALVSLADELNLGIRRGVDEEADPDDGVKPGRKRKKGGGGEGGNAPPVSSGTPPAPPTSSGSQAQSFEPLPFVIGTLSAEFDLGAQPFVGAELILTPPPFYLMGEWEAAQFLRGGVLNSLEARSPVNVTRSFDLTR
ncbi:MAG: hypothetical protein Q7S00_00875, partial [bacterium]|nr:hypothetical protein [bacterium]